VESREIGSVVPETLREYAALTRSALDRRLPSMEPRRYLYDLVADYPRRGGKGLRPSLCIAASRVFGAAVEEALSVAVFIELLHNATLVLDDIQDESEERRGRPALHVLHGVPLALNAGTSLTLLSFLPLVEHCARLGPQLALRIVAETERMTRELIEGQALELGWRRDNVIGLGDEDYFEMVLKKTCWYGMMYPAALGALTGTRNPGLDLAPFLRYGYFVGAAFQVRDDVLNLVGTEAYGKEINGDIWEGKRSLILIHLLREAVPAERDRLIALLALPRAARSEADVLWVRRLMDRYGSIEYAQRIAEGMAGAALHEHSLAYGHLPESRDKAFLRELASWVVLRTS
jgi:geranylgeranyl diphosphate synthase type II